jgi:DNA replication protein DnaT
VARIRTLKPSFWSDATMSSVSRDARLLAVGLISFADDEGIFLAAPGAILGYVFPLDPTVTIALVKRWRDQLAATGVIGCYSVGGFEYGYWPNWLDHQKISHPIKSTFPRPRVGADS